DQDRNDRSQRGQHLGSADASQSNSQVLGPAYSIGGPLADVQQVATHFVKACTDLLGSLPELAERLLDLGPVCRDPIEALADLVEGLLVGSRDLACPALQRAVLCPHSDTTEQALQLVFQRVENTGAHDA